VKPSSFHVGLFVCWGFFFVVGFFIWSGLLVGWHNLMTVDRFFGLVYDEAWEREGGI
jgi:hypothetical protein